MNNSPFLQYRKSIHKLDLYYSFCIIVLKEELFLNSNTWWLVAVFPLLYLALVHAENIYELFLGFEYFFEDFLFSFFVLGFGMIFSIGILLFILKKKRGFYIVSLGLVLEILIGFLLLGTINIFNFQDVLSAGSFLIVIPLLTLLLVIKSKNVFFRTY